MDPLDPNKCELCAKTYVRAKDLRRHIRIIHEQKGVETCQDCGSVFKYRSSFKRHQLLHIINETANLLPDDVDRYICAECGVTYWRKEDLRRHVVRKHLRSTPVEDITYECYDCPRKFKRKSSLWRHIKHLHLSEQTVQVKKNRCIECGKLFSMECLLIGHYRNDHGLEIEEEELFFDDDKSFTDWKREMENRTWSTFSKAGTRRTKKYAAIDQFVCHLRGSHLPQDSPKRSKKINGICPAKILRFINSDGSSKISYVKTHLGHPLNFRKLARVPHSSKVIENVVTQTSKTTVRNATAEKNLRNANQTEAGCEPLATTEGIQEICLPSWGDIHNISILPDIDTSVYDLPNDPIENRQDVVFYKKENESYSGLEDGDFVLVLMNEEQRKMLEVFGSDLIILDSTFDRGGSVFLLHTLWVLDDYKEVYPCAFLITNRPDKSVSDIFFSCVKGRLGRTMSTEVIISNMEDNFYQSWCSVMGQQLRFSFFFTQPVEQEWFAHLHKVKSDEKKTAIASLLEELRTDTDCEQFENKIVEFLLLNDTDLREFLDYFFINYFENREQWAHCYRSSYVGINTNVTLERFANVIERHFRDGFTSKNIAELTAELDVYRESRQNYMVYGELTSKMRLLRRSHDIAQTHFINRKPVVLERINITSWRISSFTNPEKTYLIVKGRTCDSCKIVCYDCCKDLCAHSLRCTCVENSIEDVMCEHIHYLLLRTPLELIENPLFEIEEVRSQTVDDVKFAQESASDENNCFPIASTFSEEARKSIICSIQEEYSQIVAKAKNEEQLRFLWDELKKINARMNTIETPTTVEPKYFTCD